MTAFLLILSMWIPNSDAEPGANYKTPQAVFDASRKAIGKEDFKTFIECVAPEARREYAGMLAASAIMIKSLPADIEGIAAMKKAIGAILDKHGLSEKATAGIKVGPGPVGDPKSRAALGKLVKKPEAFMLDVMEASGVVGPLIAPPGKPAVKLADVKIDGNKATGTIVSDFGGGIESKEKVSFVKKANGWRMIPSHDMGAAATPAPPKDK